MTSVKQAEIGGSDAVKGLDKNQLQSQALCKTRVARTSAVVGIHGSEGASRAINGYRDNDVTANLVNAKHNNLGVYSVPKESRRAKASSNVNWN